MGALRIGLSYWGICADFKEHQNIHVDTPDGHRYARPLMIRALQTAGHEVYALQKRRELWPFSNVKYACENTFAEAMMGKHGDPTLRPPPINHFPDLDVIFLEWRWPTYKNDRSDPRHDPSKYEPDLDRQREIIEFYRGKVPIIAWDTDLKITPDDEERYPELILTDPSSETNSQTRKRISLPFWTDWSELFPVADPYPVYGYVGNNYERPYEFERFYYSAAPDAREQAGVQTSMYGNWLQRSPDRTQPETLIQSHPDVAFNHRMNFYDSMAIMNRFLCTTHVSKPRYYQTGFLSPRYLESLAVNCPGLVPSTHLLNKALGPRSMVVDRSDVNRMIRTLKAMSVAERTEFMQEQRDFMRRMGKFDVRDVVSFIESVKR